MAFFAWSETYNTGIGSIDTQHKRLVAMINELYEAMSSGKGKETVGKVLTELVGYTRTHFSFEEGLMSNNGYPDFPAHKEIHVKLIAKVEEYVDQFRSGQMVSSVSLSNFLKDWLQSHIQGTDKKYAPFLLEKSVK
jgi:hemerythrin